MDWIANAGTLLSNALRQSEVTDTQEACPLQINPDLPPATVIFGRSRPMRYLRKRLERIGTTSVPVLITGESGTGKEILANLIHAASPRRGGNFVKVNCAAIPAELIESELFGYEQGAFTGACRSKPGLVEVAQGGTLFLDEIAELNLHLQAKLLHVLQDGCFAHIGGRETLHADFRVICATGRDLEKNIASGRFRQDLYYRINVVKLELPPLRARSVDIPTLVEYFLGRYGKEYNRNPAPIAPPLMELLTQHDWPGNIRQLENLIRRYLIFGSEQALLSDLLHKEQTTVMPGISVKGGLSLKAMTKQAVRQLERRIILEVLQANNWNRKDAARKLKISYRSLFYKIKAAGLPQKTVRIQTALVRHEEKPC